MGAAGLPGLRGGRGRLRSRRRSVGTLPGEAVPDEGGFGWGRLAGQGGLPRLDGEVAAAQPEQLLGTAGVPQVQTLQAGDGVHRRQPGGRAGELADGDGPVEPDDGGVLHPQQRVVERDDVGPVGLLQAGCLGVAGGDGRLQLEPAGGEPAGIGNFS